MIKFIIKLLLLSGSCKGPRRKRRKGNAMNQNGYHPQGMQGYGAGQNGYAAPQYATPQVSFAQNAEQGYAQPNAPYTAPGAYAPQSSFSMPLQQNGYGMYSQQGGTGTFIPQTPYIRGGIHRKPDMLRRAGTLREVILHRADISSSDTSRAATRSRTDTRPVTTLTDRWAEYLTRGR